MDTARILIPDAFSSRQPFTREPLAFSNELTLGIEITLEVKASCPAADGQHTTKPIVFFKDFFSHNGFSVFLIFFKRYRSFACPL